MTDTSITAFYLTMTPIFISLYVCKGASQWSLCFRPHAVLQCSDSEIVGLNMAVRLGTSPRCFCVRVVGRGVELSRSFVQRSYKIPNKDSEFRNLTLKCNTAEAVI